MGATSWRLWIAAALSAAACVGPDPDLCPGDGTLDVGRTEDGGLVPGASVTARPGLVESRTADPPASGTIRVVYRVDGAAVAVPGAAVTEVECVAGSGDVIGRPAGGTGSGGDFAIECPADHPRVRGRVELGSAWTVIVGPDGQPILQRFDFATGVGEVAVPVAAGRAFNTINYGASLAAARFGVSRPRIPVQLDGSGIGPLGARYAPDTDRIEAASAAFDSYPFEEAFFKILHEYGHAFHYVAIEPWRSYRCINGVHAFEAENTLSCAFVEGFAHFFAAWVGGDRLDSDEALPNAASDRVLEENLYRGRLTDGARAPGVVAAWLYDLADGPDSPDGPGNTANGDEPFDRLAVSGADLVRLIRDCRLVPPAGCPVIDRVDGVDQLVACGEGNAAVASGRRWRAYRSAESAVAPLGGPADGFRRLWQLDLYGEE